MRLKRGADADEASLMRRKCAKSIYELSTRADKGPLLVENGVLEALSTLSSVSVSGARVVLYLTYAMSWEATQSFKSIKCAFVYQGFFLRQHFARTVWRSRMRCRNTLTSHEVSQYHSVCVSHQFALPASARCQDQADAYNSRRNPSDLVPIMDRWTIRGRYGMSEHPTQTWPF